MATAWQIIFREVAKHANAFRSGSAATTATDYTTSPLTTTQVADPYFNLDFIKDLAIDAHGRLANEIANVREHPWRAWIGNSQTGNLSNGAVIPTTATNSKTIVGALGQVNVGGVPLDEANPDRVRAYNINQIPETYGEQPYLYYIDGNRIYHTESTVVINVCTYERADVVTAVAANGNITLPDVLVDAIVAGAVASLLVEGKGAEMGAYFQNYFQLCVTSIRQAQTTMPRMTLKTAA